MEKWKTNFLIMLFNICVSTGNLICGLAYLMRQKPAFLEAGFSLSLGLLLIGVILFKVEVEARLEREREARLHEIQHWRYRMNRTLREAKEAEEDELRNV